MTVLTDAVGSGEDGEGDRGVEGSGIRLVELLFFAYRDFVGEADAVLAEHGLGRAHHRVLHFVTRRPDMAVADLLDTLKITKQSLGRVLRDLVAHGLVEQRPGTADRRQRLLSPTEAGRRLARRLSAMQAERMEAALPGSPDARALVSGFLLNLVDERDRGRVRDAVFDARVPP